MAIISNTKANSALVRLHLGCWDDWFLGVPEPAPCGSAISRFDDPLRPLSSAIYFPREVAMSLSNWNPAHHRASRRADPRIARDHAVTEDLCGV